MAHHDLQSNPPPEVEPPSIPELLLVATGPDPDRAIPALDQLFTAAEQAAGWMVRRALGHHVYHGAGAAERALRSVVSRVAADLDQCSARDHASFAMWVQERATTVILQALQIDLPATRTHADALRRGSRPSAPGLAGDRPVARPVAFEPSLRSLSAGSGETRLLSDDAEARKEARQDAAVFLRALPPVLQTEAVTQCFVALPATHRRLLIVRTVYAQTWAEIAGPLNMTPDAARRRHARAMDTLQRLIRNRAA